jgi:hypothetical protein
MGKGARSLVDNFVDRVARYQRRCGQYEEERVCLKIKHIKKSI